jgi:plasmid stabilization system protein ParE
VKHDFHVAARVEHLDHIAYYESRQSGLGREYLAEFEVAIALILEGPSRFPIESTPGIRRYHLRRFPVTLIYRVIGDSVQILAVAHKRRRPGYWAARI